MKNKFDISILVPVFNEEESITILYNELKNNLDPLYNWEVIFVNDGSTDNSSQIIIELIDKESNVKQISFFQNKGKSEALNVGFKECKGDYIVTIDADLQDDPSEIKNLIDKIKDGYDMVSGWKKNRKDSITKTFPSKIYNFVLRLISGIKLHDFNCGLKAYKSNIVKVINIYGGLHRFIPIIVKQNGFKKIAEIPVNHRERKFGKSKYGSSRLLHGFFDLITVLFLNKYFSRPLHFFGSIGFLLTFLGLTINTYLTYNWFYYKYFVEFNKDVQFTLDRPLLFFGILTLIIGFQLISLGLIGELIVRYYKKNDTIDYNIDE